MNCPNCNTFNVNTATFCASCGLKFEKPRQAESSANGAEKESGAKRHAYHKPQPVGSRYSFKAIACLIASLIGIFFAGIICGAVGIVLGILAISELIKNPPLKGMGIAIFGLSLSVIDCILMIIFIANGSLAF